MSWAEHGVKIVHSDELDLNTPQTSGMTRAAAITHARTGASKLWAGTMLVQPDAKTGVVRFTERDGQATEHLLLVLRKALGTADSVDIRWQRR